jgi:hypothetical protein
LERDTDREREIGEGKGVWRGIWIWRGKLERERGKCPQKTTHREKED